MSLIHVSAVFKGFPQNVQVCSLTDTPFTWDVHVSTVGGDSPPMAASPEVTPKEIGRRVARRFRPAGFVLFIGRVKPRHARRKGYKRAL